MRNPILARAMLTVILGLPLASCATLPPPAATATCDYASVKSAPGQIWWAQQRWRYANDDEAIAAYTTLAVGTAGETSPWPNWFVPPLPQPPQTILPVGARFQMAMSPNKTDSEPGGWGTFDNIATVADVRDFLAVQRKFKPEIDRVITWEVIRPLPVFVGPVGPQVDTETCRYLPGRWSQIKLNPPVWSELLTYIKPVEVRPIH